MFHNDNDNRMLSPQTQPQGPQAGRQRYPNIVLAVRSTHEDVELERRRTASIDDSVCSARQSIPSGTEDPSTSLHDGSTNPEDEKRRRCCLFRSWGVGDGCWTRAILKCQAPVKRFLRDRLAVPSAQHPKLCLSGISVVSVLLLTAGILTNIRIESSETALWTPRGSLPEQDNDWIRNVWNVLKNPDPDIFQKKNLTVYMLVHAQGANILTLDGALHNFEALDRVRSVKGYQQHCAQHGISPCPAAEIESICSLFNVDVNSTKVCPIGGVSAYWFHNTTIFQTNVETDQQVQETLSVNVFPGQEQIFDVNDFLGNPVYETDVATGKKVLVSAQSYLTALIIPGTNDGDTDLEDRMVAEILQLQKEWDDNPTNSNSTLSFRVEVSSSHSYEAEFLRGVYSDLPLLILVFVLMSGFTALVFWQPGDWLHSQTMLGIGSVITVLMSIMTGYGIMFCAGVPFTTLTTAMLYVTFGIALDDTYILHCAYVRTKHLTDTVERIRATFDETAISILMTTVTTEVAFLVGCFSPIPAIRWLCLYALTTIGIDFIYQVTFFIALVALDEKRIKAKRKDWLICYKVADGGSDGDLDGFNGVHSDVQRVAANDFPAHEDVTSETYDANETADAKAVALDDVGNKHLHRSGRVMERYADIILIPWVKALIIVVFIGFFGLCIWSTTCLKQNFDFRSTLPSNSYVIDFFDAVNSYTDRERPAPHIYFRHVDQSDPEIQSQMISYVNDIVGIDAISEQPFRFWARDYQEYIAARNLTDISYRDVPFIVRLYLFLEESDHDYLGDLLFDETGQQLLASRTLVYMDKIDATVLKSGLNAYEQQRVISSAQPVNKNGGSWAFFTFDRIYMLWEFLRITPVQLTQSTVSGIVAVILVSIFFMPHWSGLIFVTPMVVVLYIDLMGFVQFCGLDMNGVTFVALLMSIGLLVDYMMHVTLRYYETPISSSRDAKVKDVLKTVGGSVMLGGISTFLGIVPLMFSSNDIIKSFVISFAGVVILGLAHGLILLPVLLSLVGPEPR